MMLDLFASLSIYVLPIIIGFGFIRKFFFGYILGSLLIYLTFFLASFLTNFVGLKFGFDNIVYFLLINLTTISIINYVFYMYKNYFRLPKIKVNLEELFAVLLLVVFSVLVYFLIWKAHTPYPLQLNWDIYEHITLANKITLAGFSFFPSHISDTFTFDGYSSFFQSLLSLPTILFKTNLIGVYWWLEYWHYFLSIFASYLLVKKVTGNKYLAVLSGMIGGLIFESSIVFAAFFLIPQTIAALVTVLALHQIFDLEINLKSLLKSFGLFLILAIFLILIHFIIGALGILILATFLLLKSKLFNTKTINWLLIILYIGAALIFILNQFGGLTITNREEADHFLLSLSKKVNLFLDWYSLSLPIFFILGSIVVFKKGLKDHKIILALSLLLFIIAFAPLSYFLKFYVLDRYFINAVLVFGLGYLIYFLPKIYRVIISGWVIISLLWVFNANQLDYKEYLYYLGYQSQISFTEINSAIWLKQNYPKNTFIVSDPSTAYILEAVSGLNTQGGAYSDEKTRRMLSDVYNSRDGILIFEKLNSIKDKLDYEDKTRGKTLFVVSGRFFAWQRLSEEQRLSFFYNIWQPQSIQQQDLPFVNFLTSDSSFKVVYRNSELVIMEI